MRRPAAEPEGLMLIREPYRHTLTVYYGEGDLATALLFYYAKTKNSWQNLSLTLDLPELCSCFRLSRCGSLVNKLYSSLVRAKDLFSQRDP